MDTPRPSGLNDHDANGKPTLRFASDERHKRDTCRGQEDVLGGRAPVPSVLEGQLEEVVPWHLVTHTGSRTACMARDVTQTLLPSQ